MLAKQVLVSLSYIPNPPLAFNEKREQCGAHSWCQAAGRYLHANGKHLVDTYWFPGAEGIDVNKKKAVSLFGGAQFPRGGDQQTLKWIKETFSCGDLQ